MTVPRWRALVLLFPDVELLDFAGPLEVFTSSRRFDVSTAAPTDRPLRCRNGLVVVPDRTLAEAPASQILMVPGGAGVWNARTDRALVRWIADRARASELVTSVCTGSFLLAAAGLLDGREATTHVSRLDDLQRQHPQIRVRRDTRVVDAGPVISAAGVSAGIDMALHVVERLCGAEEARRIARDIEWPF